MENLEVGMKLHAMWLNWRYYYAEIINIKKKKKKAPVKVHYMGYEGFDAWLSLDMLKCKALKGASKALAKEKAPATRLFWGSDLLTIKSITAMMLPVSRRGRSRSPRIRRQRERKKRGRSPGDLLRLDQTECLRRPRSLQLK
eukprot:g32919.t1